MVRRGGVALAAVVAVLAYRFRRRRVPPAGLALLVLGRCARRGRQRQQRPVRTQIGPVRLPDAGDRYAVVIRSGNLGTGGYSFRLESG
ncbi:hypothetical protein AB0K09_19410 [Streptomyces sp. NPDC049577]|uniref:hypothetical protein n=1 Tax=Streptomyces sp. NPDC049577 TaxID=3155153 RepID=UPI00342C00A7